MKSELQELYSTFFEFVSYYFQVEKSAMRQSGPFSIFKKIDYGEIAGQFSSIGFEIFMSGGDVEYNVYKNDPVYGEFTVLLFSALQTLRELADGQSDLYKRLDEKAHGVTYSMQDYKSDIQKLDALKDKTTLVVDNLKRKYFQIFS